MARQSHAPRRRAVAGTHPQPGSRKDARAETPRIKLKIIAQGPGTRPPRHHPRALIQVRSVRCGFGRRRPSGSSVFTSATSKTTEDLKKAITVSATRPRQAQELQHRLAQQSGGLLRQAISVLGCPSMEEGRDRVDARPHRAENPAVQCALSAASPATSPSSSVSTRSASPSELSRVRLQDHRRWRPSSAAAAFSCTGSVQNHHSLWLRNGARPAGPRRANSPQAGAFDSRAKVSRRDIDWCCARRA